MRDGGIDGDHQIEMRDQRGGIGKIRDRRHQVDQRESCRHCRAVLLQADEANARCFK